MLIIEWDVLLENWSKVTIFLIKSGFNKFTETSMVVIFMHKIIQRRSNFPAPSPKLPIIPKVMKVVFCCVIKFIVIKQVS